MQYSKDSDPRRNLRGLTLADGVTYGVASADSSASKFVAFFAQTIGLTPAHNPAYVFLAYHRGDREDTHSVSPRQTTKLWRSESGLNRETSSSFKNSMMVAQPLGVCESIFCAVDTTAEGDSFVLELMRFSLKIVQRAENNRAVLFHAALVSHADRGVLLVGPSGVGKTTATRRLPSSWRALSDDLSLVVCDRSGTYWAHPWPSWSLFTDANAGCTWNVSEAVRVDGIYLLSQASNDSATLLGEGEAVCSLFESSRQAAMLKLFDIDQGVKRLLNFRRFDNVCSLVKAVPMFQLNNTKKGAFWLEIERNLEID